MEGDLRKFEMVITPLGRTVQKRGRDMVTQALEKTMGKITKEEREAFISYNSQNEQKRLTLHNAQATLAHLAAWCIIQLRQDMKYEC